MFSCKKQTLVIIAVTVIHICDGSVQRLEKSLDLLAKSNLKFSLELYQSLVRADDKGNVLFSPINVALLLSTTKNEEKYWNEISDVLFLNEFNSVKVHSLINELNSLILDEAYENITIDNTNLAFYGENVKISDALKSTWKVSKIKPFKLNFENDPITKINDVISEVTSDEVFHALSGKDISVSPKLLLINTMRYSGTWYKGFNPREIEKRAFHESPYRIVKTPFMFQRGQFRYGYIASLTLQILELPYLDSKISMLLLMPENFDFKGVEKNLNYENLTTWLSDLKVKTVELTIPKFNISENLVLKQPLKELGVKTLFEDDNDFSNVVQLSHLEVTHSGNIRQEEVFEADKVFPNEREVVYMDHPFIILLLHKPSNAVLFMGALKKVKGKVIGHDEL